jgi:hypothetical protein
MDQGSVRQDFGFGQPSTAVWRKQPDGVVVIRWLPGDATPEDVEAVIREMLPPPAGPPEEG